MHIYIVLCLNIPHLQRWKRLLQIQNILMHFELLKQETVVSPLTIAFLLLKVSRIPMLEVKYQGNPEFEAYKTRTNGFFPWFERKPDIRSSPSKGPRL